MNAPAIILILFLTFTSASVASVQQTAKGDHDHVVKRIPDVDIVTPEEYLKEEGYALNVAGVRKALSAEHPMTTKFATEVAAHRKLVQLAPELTQLLNSKYSLIRVSSAKALLILNKSSEKVTKTLTDVVVHSNFISPVLDAATILAKQGNAAGLPRIAHLLLNIERAPYSRELAAKALGSFDHLRKNDFVPEDLLWRSIHQELRRRNQGAPSKKDLAVTRAIVQAAVGSLVKLGDADTLKQLKHLTRTDPNIKNTIMRAVQSLVQKLKQQNVAHASSGR